MAIHAYKVDPTRCQLNSDRDTPIHILIQTQRVPATELLDRGVDKRGRVRDRDRVQKRMIFTVKRIKD